VVPVGAAPVRFSPLLKRETQLKSSIRRQVRIQSVIPVSLPAVHRASRLAVRVNLPAILVSQPVIHVFLALVPV